MLFVTTKLDYCNSLLCGAPSTLINKLQRIQNIVARIITEHGRCEHITPVLKAPHWLPVQQRIKFKILVLVYKAVNNLAPVYLQELLHPHVPCRGLRSSEMNLLVVPFTRFRAHCGFYAIENKLLLLLLLILCHLNYGVLLWGPKLHMNDRLHILQKICSNYNM